LPRVEVADHEANDCVHVLGIADQIIVNGIAQIVLNPDVAAVGVIFPAVILVAVSTKPEPSEIWTR